MNLYLIGHRCTGKTTLGRALARRLGRAFVDTDDRIVAQSGQSIADMVARHGWDHFRSREHDLIKKLSQQQDQVVATGGGIVLFTDNVAIMRAGGRVVWLRCRPDTIHRRMTADPRSGDMRPKLTPADTLHEEIETTLKAREPLYRKAMDIAVDTDDFDMDQLCDTIMAALPINRITE